jgi:hypothetical protein
MHHEALALHLNGASRTVISNAVINADAFPEGVGEQNYDERFD